MKIICTSTNYTDRILPWLEENHIKYKEIYEEKYENYPHCFKKFKISKKDEAFFILKFGAMLEKSKTTEYYVWYAE